VTRALASEASDLVFVDLGRHRLRDVGDERLFQLAAAEPDATFPPLRTSSATNLPVLRGPTFGRDEALAELAELLRSGVRLVTLVGPGGTGKSRLAIEAARALVGELAHGVHLVRLATIDDAELVATEVARSFGIQDARDVAAALYDYLGDRELLLVLDNFEHVADAAVRRRARRALRVHPRAVHQPLAASSVARARRAGRAARRERRGRALRRARPHRRQPVPPPGG
jgi:hypothetical protein